MKVKIELPEFVNHILDEFTKAGYEIYVVGGAVRDLLTGGDIDDWDFTTDATPEEILNVFPEGFYDNSYGTVGLSHDSSPNPYEITTFRREEGYSDARRPDHVEWGESLSEDLKRRDFTINAMAIQKSNGSYSLIDPFNGQEDLNKKLIRAVGDANDRFAEDALRLMRAVRIAAETGFDIEKNTFRAIQTNAALINKIAKERVRDELVKLLASPNPYEGMLMLKETGLMDEILPELSKCFGVEQKSPNRHHIYDVGTHNLNSLREVAKKTNDPIVRFATLIHDIGKPQTFRKLDNGTITFYNHEVIGGRIARNITERLRFSKNDAERIYKLVRYHQFTVDDNQTDSAIRRFIRHVGPQNIQDMLDLRVGDRLGGGAKETSWRLEEFKKRLIEVQKQPFSIKDLKINGEDVKNELGIPPGPKVGEMLNKLYKEVVAKKLENEKSALNARLKEIS